VGQNRLYSGKDIIHKQKHMTLKPGSILTTPMVIALMAFAIVAFLLLIDTSIMPKEKSPNTNLIVNRSTNTNTVTTTTNTNSTTEGTFSTNTNAEAE